MEQNNSNLVEQLNKYDDIHRYNPEIIKQYKGHTGSINSACFDQSMKQIASASTDGNVQVWSVNGQQRTFKFTGHEGSVNDVQFSPDSQYLVSGGDDRTIRIWDNKYMTKCHVINGHGGAIKSINFDDKGDLLISSSTDKTMKIWKINGSKKKKHEFLVALTGHKNWVRSSMFGPNNIIGSGSDDRSVKLWDINTKKIIHSYEYHYDIVNQIKFSCDSHSLASCSDDKSIKIYDIRSHQLVQNYDCSQGVSSISFHPSSHFLVSTSSDNVMRLWDLRQGRLAKTIDGQNNGAQFNKQGDHIVSEGKDNSVCLWKTNFNLNLYVDQLQKIQESNKENTRINQSQQSNSKYQIILSEQYTPYKNITQQSQNQSVQYTPQGEEKENTQQKQKINQNKSQNESNVILQQKYIKSMIQSIAQSFRKITDQIENINISVNKLDNKLSQNESQINQLAQSNLIQSVQKNELLVTDNYYHGSIWDTFKGDQSIQPQNTLFQNTNQHDNIFSKGALVNTRIMKKPINQEIKE